MDKKSTDPLLENLVYLTRHYGRAKSADAILAGLPYDENNMSPSLFCEAAIRLGLKAKITERKNISSIPEAVLPAVLIMKGDKALILLKKDGLVFDPQDGKEKNITFKDLEKDYTGHAMFVQPENAFSGDDAEGKKHWFWETFQDNRAIYARVAVAAILINLFGLTSPIFIMNVYDRVIPNSAIETGWVLGIGALTVFIFDFIMRTLRGYFLDLAGRKTDVIAGKRIYDQVLNMKLSERPSSSGAFANMLKDFDSVRDFMTSATLTGLIDLPFTLLFLFVIYLLGGPIAFLLTLLIIIVFVTGILLQIPLRNLVQKSVKSSEAKHGLLVETIQGLETIKAIGADGRLRSRYGDYMAENAKYGQQSRFVSALGVNIASFLQQSASIMIVLMGMYLVMDQNLTMGGLIACVILGGRAIAPIGQVANLMARYHSASGALKTLNGIMQKPVERPSQNSFLHRPDLKGKITFDKVQFSYPGTDRVVLENASFSINPGEKVGIIGRVGSGKSTIARLIMGLYGPDSGTILMDDTDYRQIDPADLRRTIAYIAQDVILFAGTIKENIAVSVPHADEEEILRVSKASGVHDFVSRHPAGYDAMVGERGEGLSGGQRQAVALARAMLLKPNVMICDEPTNAMDMQAEEAFTKHIQEEAKDKTLILITHRQNLLPVLDRLILLDQGKVIMDGPRDKVMQALAGGKIEVPKE